MPRLFLTLTLILGLMAGLVGGPGARPARAETAPQTVVDPALSSALLTSAGPLEVIVTFRGDGAPTESQTDLLSALGITQGVTLRALPMAGVLATAVQIEALAGSPEVRSLWLNHRLSYENEGGTAITGVDRLRADGDMTAANGGLPVSGRGVAVVINDSGVDGTHPDHKFGPHLVQNVLGQTNLNSWSGLLPITYVEDVPNTDSTGGHGTHVAGIVGATGAMSSGKYEGVAPGADLIGYGSGAALAILDTLGAFDWSLWNQATYGIRVITNSWGSTGDTGTAFNPDDPINVATKKAFDRNIVVVFSAGNSGPGEGSITGNYKKAPWVIAVAAGDKQGGLASFSSRGIKDRAGIVTVDGQLFVWEDRPTVTAPGVQIISTRVVAPVSSLGAADDAALIDPAHLPYYTTMSGTSMAAPHVAGIVALMLDANPALTPLQVKEILQQTATNMPGMESWQAGAGYVNAYAAVDRAFRATAGYGATLNLTRSFNSSATFSATTSDWNVSYNPALAASNQFPFTVQPGQAELVAKAKVTGLLGETGNTINLALIAPNGTRYSSGVSALFTLYPDRTVSVPSPMAGTWNLELSGIVTGNLALPEEVSGTLTFRQAGGFTGLDDVAGHPAETAIRLAVSKRLVDGDSDRKFRPDQYLTRGDLASYLTMGTGVRQYLPFDGGATFSDVSAAELPFAEAAAARGAALKDAGLGARGVILPTGETTFSPNQQVRRAELAYSLVQSLGLEQEALASNDQTLTVQYGSSRIAIEDADQVPAHLRGYVQLALDGNILNAYFHTTQGPYDLQPTIHATFRPTDKVSRGDYAVAATRFFSAYLSQ